MVTILAFLFVIGILVFIHELGHFLIAKWCGVRVEKFSLGFGKKLLGFKRGETEYLISALPFGGYVKMYGEGGEENFIIDWVEPGSPAEKRGFKPGDKIIKIEEVQADTFSTWDELKVYLKKTPDLEYTVILERDEKRLKLKTPGDALEGLKAFSLKEYPRSFSNQPIINRFLIVIAGPLMNIVLPFLLMPIVFMSGISTPAYLEKPPVVGYVEPNSLAEQAGFKKGDKIIEIGGKRVYTWKEVNIAFQMNPDTTLDVKVERGGNIKTLRVKTASSQGIVSIGIAEVLEARVGDVIDGTPAKEVGLKRGDKIIEIDGVKISDWYQMASIIRNKVNQEITLLVERNGKVLKFKITPQPLQENGQGAIGITPYREEIVKKYGFFRSIVEGIKEAAELIVEVTVLLFSFLYNIITGKITLGTAGKSIAGPLLIAKVSGSAAKSGIAPLLQFTSFISINLALINLLPIPMLDGGHVLYLLIELIRRKPLSQRTLEISQRIGFTFLIFIMFLAIYNDISRFKGSIIDSINRLIEALK
ncbi:MAG: hypothetical protein KatS3mg078_0860 [Deltaproteobacteria bacterium]|jgi:regulator of sigma E protease|nr:MAG: hypothetical protein KatS3mg078_0860 [Deltaproteobacteria bacterium]